MDGKPGEWAVMYHGVWNPTRKVSNPFATVNTTTAKTIVDNNLKPGHGQVW